MDYFTSRQNSLEEAILRTMIYADVFEYPLQVAEIHFFLIGMRATLDEVYEVLSTSPRLAVDLEQIGDYYTLRGRSDLVALREKRADASVKLWKKAERYAAQIARLPFVRMVAITGALSMLNADDHHDDIDYLVVTAAGRVWLARLLALGVVRLARLRGVHLCPNYVLSESALPQTPRDLFIAHEIVQMVPLFGIPVYQNMRWINGWTQVHLPNATDTHRPVPDLSPKRLGKSLQRIGERLLGGRLGTALEQWEMRRKQRKLRAENPQRSPAVFLDATQVKGHFTDHGARVLTQYKAGLVAHNLREASGKTAPLSSG